MALKAKVTMKKNWSQNIESGMKKAVLEVAVDIDKRAKILAPVDSGALVNSGKIEPVKNGYKISFGSSKVPYARRQHFENRYYSMYLYDAAESVGRSGKGKYFIGKIKP